MELLEKIAKLKQDIVTVSTKPQPTPEKFEYPPLDLSAFNSENPNFKGLLDEKQQRIYDLEEELEHLRRSAKQREQDLTEKYEGMLKSAKANADSLTHYYETLLNNLKNQEPPAETLETLKKELEAKNKVIEEFHNEKAKLADELCDLKEEIEYTKLQLNSKNSSKQRGWGDFEGKLDQAIEIAELWKERNDQLALKFFTFLRSLRIDLYELKNCTMIYFEDALTETSKVVAESIKKTRKVRFMKERRDLQQTNKTLVQENRRLRVMASKPNQSSYK